MGDGPILDFSLLDGDGDEPRLTYHAVANTALLREGRPQTIRIGVKVIAVVKHRGEVYALNDRCPHAGGSLGAGELVDGKLLCPVHRWAFDVATGACREHDIYCARTYPVDIRGREVYVGIPEE
jgi:nitrite reductase/ring-hydroxylating ferredoxin subunit